MPLRLCFICLDFLFSAARVKNNSFMPESLSDADVALLLLADGACAQVKCPKFKVCMENFQGMPLCTCPTSYTCRNKKQKEVCGTDGVTYPSRCHMRLARCQTGTRIKVSKKGSCQAGEEDSEQTLSRVRRRKERRRRRNGKKVDAQKRAEEKEKRERRRRKRRLRKLRRRQRRKSLKDRFQQTFSSYKW